MAATPEASQARRVERWSGEPGTVGTVTVVGLGKIGLPLAAQYAASGWHVIGVDVLPRVVEAVNRGESHVAEEPGLAERIAEAHAAGRLEATYDHDAAARRSDVVVIIVPLILKADRQPDYRLLDAATTAVGQGLRPGALVTYETTLPVGDTRNRFAPMLANASGLRLGGDDGLHVAFSPERVFSGRVFADLATYPKLVGGIDASSTERAYAFYASVLRAPVWPMGNSETAEFAKLAETTYRDVNIALANEFASYAERAGVDILEVIRGANSQPYSHIHQPGIGVGGHCIPVYPHFLLERAPELALVRTSREINDGQVQQAIDTVRSELGDLRGVDVLVLGLTYREHVHELAYSRALPLIERLRAAGADVSASDPLLTDDEIARSGAVPFHWGDRSSARVIFTQTADPLWATINHDLFPRLELVLDGRNSLRDHMWPAAVAYRGIGVAPQRQRQATSGVDGRSAPDT
jgi:nucleotide sugar dehydrogenase